MFFSVHCVVSAFAREMITTAPQMHIHCCSPLLQCVIDFKFGFDILVVNTAITYISVHQRGYEGQKAKASQKVNNSSKSTAELRTQVDITNLPYRTAQFAT